MPAARDVMRKMPAWRSVTKWNFYVNTPRSIPFLILFFTQFSEASFFHFLEMVLVFLLIIGSLAQSDVISLSATFSFDASGGSQSATVSLTALWLMRILERIEYCGGTKEWRDSNTTGRMCASWPRWNTGLWMTRKRQALGIPFGR